MNTTRAVGVLGSANMDLVVRVQAPPRPGETVFGSEFTTVPGGKGLNQAVAAARAGAPVTFIGTVGTDGYGDELAALMLREGMDPRHLRREGVTGTAHITVDAEGQNSIIVVSAANRLTSAEHITDELLAGLGWLVTQLELDVDTVSAALGRAHRAGVRTVLTPAPARRLDEAVLRNVDLLVPNELEACILAGVDDPADAACALSEFCRDVVVTLGAEGALHASGGRIVAEIHGRPAQAVDTTAAGDTFVGVLVALLAEGASLSHALWVATTAASISVTRHGATSSMPARAEIDAAL